jgi:beta-carotene 3-hydroxylase
MEPVSYAAHRWVMHGAGWVLHESHHRTAVGRAAPGGQPGSHRRPWPARLEANDAFPALFAGATVAGLALGTRVPAVRALVPAGLGVTAYGAAYAVVHDLYAHQRFTRLPRCSPLEGLARAHARHHLDGGEPYGMLAPVVRHRPAGAVAP